MNVIKDLSTLTQLPTETLMGLVNVVEKDICHLIYENYILMGKNEIILDVGIGSLILHINTEEEYLNYEFIPSKHFERLLLKTLDEGESPLIKDIEKNFSDRVLSLYKELV